MENFFSSWCTTEASLGVFLGFSAIIAVIIAVIITKRAADNGALKWWSILSTSVAIVLSTAFFYFGRPAPAGFLSGMVFVIVVGVVLAMLFGSVAYILFISEHHGGADYDAETLLLPMLVISGGIGLLGGIWSIFGSTLPLNLYWGFLIACGIMLMMSLIMGRFSLMTLLYAPVIVVMTFLMGMFLLVALSIDPWLIIPTLCLVMIAQSTENPVPNRAFDNGFGRNSFGHDVFVRNSDGDWSHGIKYDDFTKLDNGDEIDNCNLSEYDD